MCYNTPYADHVLEMLREIVTGYPVAGLFLDCMGNVQCVGGECVREMKQRGIDWSDPALALPAFLAIIIMPVTLSITEGIAFAFIAHSLLRLAQGRTREAHWLFHLFSLLFLLRYIFITL
jgi:xanthine/uracil/vitamin C permease (AzgA family)